MGENDLKKYTVILGGGSGVLFQPLDETKTYVLSAKHVFYNTVKHDKGKDQKIIKDIISLSLSNKQDEIEEIEIISGTNYFEHSNPLIDAAILILDKNLNRNQIYIDEREKGFDGYNLTGYPNSKRKSSDKYDKQLISDLISCDDNLISLRLIVNHLDYDHITGFSGGGIIKTNGDSLLLSGIQSQTPNGDCNGEIQVVPIKRFEEIVEHNNLSKLLPSYLSNISALIDSIICFNNTIPTLRPKLKKAISVQFNQIKCELKNIFNSSYINKASISTSGKKSKYFWICFLEYALIISLIEDNIVDDNILMKMSKEKKFIFSDSTKDFYSMYDEILLFAADDINDNCQLIVGSTITPGNSKTRRRSTNKVPSNIANPDDLETIDRVIRRHKIKEIIHLKAIELDCINENDEFLDSFGIHQFEDVLNEIKKLVNEFFRN